ncbi:PH domain-containing protein [Kribbella sp. NPDC051770]|uniref:PH domain-containing protein n=1 Tax=Kribbella sp. NPDC051770 TaxID=3155413 RepID=UPI00343712CE
MESRRWGLGPVGRTLACVPTGAAVVTTLFVPEMWALVPLAAVIAVAWIRTEIRLTDDELILRYPIGSRRVPRADVLSAEFTWSSLRVTLRSGELVRIRFSPKLTSTELSGDPPPPDSAAYQITAWAQGLESAG